MSDVAKIASGLSEEERSDLLTGKWHTCPRAPQFVSIGLAQYGRGCIYLTPLGLAVRAHLLENHDV